MLKTVLICIDEADEADSDSEATVKKFRFASEGAMEKWMARCSYGAIYRDDEMVTWDELEEDVVYNTRAAAASKRIITLERSQANAIAAEEHELAHAIKGIIMQEGGYTADEVQIRMDERVVRDRLGAAIAECDACVSWPGGGRARGERKRVGLGASRILVCLCSHPSLTPSSSNTQGSLQLSCRRACMSFCLRQQHGDRCSCCHIAARCRRLGTTAAPLGGVYST